jgi:hypothetical protein
MEAKGKTSSEGQGVHVHVMTINSGVASVAVSILNFGTTWNGQVHAPAALLPQKNSLTHIEEAESALGEKPLAPNRNRTRLFGCAARSLLTKLTALYRPLPPKCERNGSI